MAHEFYSIRTGKNENANGFPLAEILELFAKIYLDLDQQGYFSEYFGFECVDEGHVSGKITDVSTDVYIKLRKKIWPISDWHTSLYREDDLLDMIEYLYQNVSRPIKGDYHSYNNCGMHWIEFDIDEGQRLFRDRINLLLKMYVNKFELSPSGIILEIPERGFEAIFKADIPNDDENIVGRVNAAVDKFRRHGANVEDRRHAVTDLAGVLERLRPYMKSTITNSDEADLFNIANNFGIRHYNDRQKTDYDMSIWLSWMFYFYLATIHVILRKRKMQGLGRRLITV